MKQYATLEDTVYFWFGSNDTSGSGGDGATPSADIRLAGAAVDAIPTLSPTPALLSHANYPAGCYEVAIAATAANGFAANGVYGVFCSLAVDSQNPTGFIGSFDLKPVKANTTQVSGTVQTANDNGADINEILTDTGELQTNQGNWVTATGFATETKQDIIDANVDQIETAVITNAAGTDIAADIIAVKAETSEIVTDTGTTLDTLIKDIPTTSEFEARSLLSDDYVVTGDTLAGVTLVTTCTTNTDMVGTDGANTVEPDPAGTAATPAEVALALTAIHLDHLFAADYDPASKPGVATALLNELVENDGGVSRYTTNALEQAPSAGTNPNVLIDTTIASVTDQTHFTLTAGSDIDDAYKYQSFVVYDASNNNYPSVRKCSAYTGATKTVTLDTAPDFIIVGGDGAESFVTAPGTTAPTVGQIRTEMEGAGTKLTLTLEDTNELQTNQGSWATATAVALSAQGKLDVNAECDTALSDYGANTTVPDAAGIAANLHTTTDGKIDTNKSELDGFQGADGKALISTDAQDLSGTLDVNTKTATATAFDLILKDSTFALAIADAIWDEILTGATHNIPTSAGRRVREIAAFAIHSGTAQAGSSVTITLDAGASANDGVYNRNLIAIVGGTGVGQTRQIADYIGSTKVTLLDREWRINPDATSEFVITANNVFALVDQGQVVAATATTVTLRPYSSSIDNTYLCNQIVIIAGLGRGQSRLVGGYNGTSKVITICGDNWVTTPDATSVYVLLPYGTTCTSCIGDSALGLIKSEADDALTDYGPNTVVPDAAGIAAALHVITDGKIDALNNITVADIIAGIADGSYDLQEMLRLIFAACCNKSSGGGTPTLIFRDSADGKNRISATVDASGNRTDVILDGS